MSPTTTDMPDTGDELPLAAEFVLGLVQGEERDALEKRRRDDYRFAQDVEFWESRLGVLASDVKPEDVPPYIWQRIVETVGPPPASRDVRAPQRSGLWQSLAFWRTLGVASSALAAACLVVLFTAPAAPPPALVATLTLTDGQSAFMATVDRMTGKVMLMPALDTPAPADHTHELWLVPVGGTPQSLGTFVAKGPVLVKMPDDMMPHASPDATLAISVEPMGGSKTGAPTGPVVASGKMHDL